MNRLTPTERYVLESLAAGAVLRQRPYSDLYEFVVPKTSRVGWQRIEPERGVNRRVVERLQFVSKLIAVGHHPVVSLGYTTFVLSDAGKELVKEIAV